MALGPDRIGSPASAMPIWGPKAARQAQITCKRRMLKTLSVLFFFSPQIAQINRINEVDAALKPLSGNL